jgi:RHS repeat-associated protein
MTMVQGDGNILSSVLYDGEGRVCATRQPLMAGLYRQTQYVYDAEGNRVAEGMIADWSKGCDLTLNGFQQTKTYIVGPGGEQMTELSVDATQTASWVHTNVQANGRLIATYANDSSNCTSSQSVPCQPLTGALHFVLSDWLGTRRVQTSYNGTTETAWANLPFGDSLQQNCSNCSGADASEQHFTGKERDTESGLDYFGARYYASNMGRWMSPDWADKPEAVPYSDLDDPQSLNLYGYVRNNPLNKADADGHDETDVLKIAGGVELIAPELTPAIVGITGGILLGQTIWNNRGAIGDAIVDAAGRGTMMGQYGDMSKQAPVAAPASGDRANSGPKAADAPTVTANGQAANAKGEKLGPSRKAQGHSKRHNTEKGAKEAAARDSKDGTARKDANPRDGRGGHYHPNDTDRSASDHHYYPNNK